MGWSWGIWLAGIQVRFKMYVGNAFIRHQGVLEVKDWQLNVPKPESIVPSNYHASVRYGQWSLPYMTITAIKSIGVGTLSGRLHPQDRLHFRL